MTGGRLRDDRAGAAIAGAKPPVCVVSSDPPIHRSLGRLLAGAGYRVVRATSLRGLSRRMVAGIQTLVTGGEQLEHDRRYTQAVATVAHEMKTPLTSIRGFAQMLRDDQLEAEEIREFAAEIHDNAVRLTRYVESILAEDAFHTGRVALDLCDVRLAPVVGQVLRDLEPWDLHRHRLVNGIDDSIAIRADVDRLTQIISNLVSNAVKYSPAGGTVSVDATATASEVEITVEDEGIGIDAEERLRVFDRFYRVPSAVSMGISGTGLGLSIVGDLVQLHGGRIWVTDGSGGRGSRFHMCLPRAIAPARPMLLPNHQAGDLPFVALIGGSVDRRQHLLTTAASQQPSQAPPASAAG